MRTVVAGRFALHRRIGSGAYGQVYRAIDAETGEDVAVKLESAGARVPQLLYEAKVYRVLAGAGCVGIPSLHWRGVDGDQVAMAVDLLGPSLEDLFNTCGRKFSLKTVLLLADQMLRRLEHVHESYFLHRDLKPENFLMGRGKGASVVHIIDFGFAKKYREKDMSHICYREGKGMLGTSRYASLKTHQGIEQSRRDDLESLGYILLYFLQGNLPWQRFAPDGCDWEQIAESKLSTPIETLCATVPTEFVTYCEYCRSLGFAAKPDYTNLRQLFRDLYTRRGYADDEQFDWMVADDRRPGSAPIDTRQALMPYDAVHLTDTGLTPPVAPTSTTASGSSGSSGTATSKPNAAFTSAK